MYLSSADAETQAVLGTFFFVFCSSAPTPTPWIQSRYFSMAFGAVATVVPPPAPPEKDGPQAAPSYECHFLKM